MVNSSGSKFQGWASRVQGLGFRVYGLRFTVERVDFRVEGFEFRMYNIIVIDVPATGVAERVAVVLGAVGLEAEAGMAAAADTSE